MKLPVDAIGLDSLKVRKLLNWLKVVSQLTRLSTQVLLMVKTSGVTTTKRAWLFLSNPAENIVLTSSCSLLHVPFTTANEEFEPAILNHFAFAVEKLDEIRDLDAIRNGQGAEALAANKELFATERVGENAELRARIAGLTDADYTRLPAFAEREAIQEEAFKLPALPTTTIGSFPQTKEVRAT